MPQCIKKVNENILSLRLISVGLTKKFCCSKMIRSQKQRINVMHKAIVAL